MISPQEPRNESLAKVIDSLIQQRADLVQATIDNETDVFDEQIDKIDKLLLGFFVQGPRPTVYRGDTKPDVYGDGKYRDSGTRKS